jgi:hypothetical protein
MLVTWLPPPGGDEETANVIISLTADELPESDLVGGVDTCISPDPG